MLRSALTIVLLLSQSSGDAEEGAPFRFLLAANDPQRDVQECSDLVDLEKYERAVELCTRAIESPSAGPHTLERAHFHRGVAYRGLGQPELAIEDYDEVLRTAPDEAMAYMNRGNAYYDLRDFHRAIEDYDRAIANASGDPNLNVIIENRGQSYVELGDYERAIQDYDESIRLDAYYAIAYNDRGAAYHHLGDDERALQDFDQAIALDPNYALPYANRALVFANRGDCTQAMRDFSRNIEIGGEDAWARFGRGVAEYCNDDFAGATRDLSRALELDPGFDYGSLWLFLSMVRQDGLERARADLSGRAGEFDLDHWPGPILRHYLGDATAAVVAGKAEGDDQKCEANYYVGALLAATGDRAGAVPRLRAALEDCPPDFVEVGGARAELARLGAASD